LAFWSKKGDWGLAVLELDVVKRDNTNGQGQERETGGAKKGTRL
jgi:hypothetical protein